MERQNKLLDQGMSQQDILDLSRLLEQQPELHTAESILQNKQKQAIFESSIDLKVDHKVNTLLSLMESFRSQIMAWHDRAYVVATTSFGLLLVITKQWMDNQSKNLIYLAGYIAIIILFSLLTQFYLRVANNAYKGNEEGKIKCEYALKLKEEDFYFHGKRFFWAEEDPKKEQGMPSHDIYILRVAHGITTIVLIFICILTSYF